jgi:enolase-phosphatase E1
LLRGATREKNMSEQRQRVILLDIEGTTTPFEFVHEVLFPFARRHLREFITQRRESRDVRADVNALRDEHRVDIERGVTPPEWSETSADKLVESVALYVDWLMDLDRKSTGLKSLQGKIWEAGYRSGGLRAPVYPDVPRTFTRWNEQSKDICIFSSGSVLAQKLLFAHTTAGDLGSFIRAYFDTTTGPKKEVASYRRIADTLSVAPAEMLFISDTSEELDAASASGMEAVLCVRPDRPEPESTLHKSIRMFDEVFVIGY